VLLIVILFLAASLAGCGSPREADRRDLRRIYAASLCQAPGMETTEEERLAFRELVERYGGPARVESLIAESMVADPVSWRAYLDSLAQNLP